MDKPTFNGQLFTWKGNKGTSNLGLLGLTEFPRDRFYILSHRSGEVRLFEPDHDTMKANEFFDGEASAYVCRGLKVQIWT